MNKRKKGQSRKPRDKQQALLFLEERMNKIANAIRTGLTINNAARAAGVNPNTFYVWKKNGQDGIEPYATLWKTCEQAIYEGEMLLANKIAKATDKDWKAAAWILERRHSDTWGKPTEVALSGGLQLDLKQLSDQELDEQIAKAERELKELQDDG